MQKKRDNISKIKTTTYLLKLDQDNIWPKKDNEAKVESQNESVREERHPREKITYTPSSLTYSKEHLL